MNRKIKFRGKRTDSGEWVCGYYFTTPLTAEYNILPENGAFFDHGLSYNRHVIADNYGCVFEVVPETVGQFTGLLDQNGKEIYEGDIIVVSYPKFFEFKKDDKIGVVRFLDTLPDFVIMEDVYPNCNMVSHFNTTGEYWEIIGNVYDNHSLIKRKHM
jgi:uncharacterized phage protein (TIGR01671 family)